MGSISIGAHPNVHWFFCSPTETGAVKNSVSTNSTRDS